MTGAVFGGADQYLGSRISLGAWAYSVSGMSAPWLLLPFLWGLTQTDRRRAMALGLTAIMAALLGYFALTLSPLEGVPLRAVPAGFAALASSNSDWVVGGLIGGPLFGLLGHRWRTARSWPAAAVVAAAFCFEPLVRLGTGRLTPATAVWLVEAAFGAGMAGYVVATSAARARRSIRGL